jgi:serine/threonine protein phosphatase 1
MKFFRQSQPETEKKEGTQGRVLAVGDIHGCLTQLERLMAKVQPAAEDLVVFLGDYVDRGPDSRGVLEYLIAFGRKFPRTVFLKGNHEEMFLDFIAGRNQLLYYNNGGESTLEQYREGSKLRIPKAHLDFLENLELCHETESFIFVHAGLRPGIPLAGQHPRDMLWIREDFLFSSYNWGKPVVFGHTPRQDVLFSRNKIGIDTGAVYGRILSCCDVESKACWQA